MVTIIVPVYNVEKYLSKCIESITAQSHADWELILVDDGSTDQSGAICDEYSANDSRIRTIHTANGGVSKARNTGLDNAKGEWIMFIDSDDWIAGNCLEKCISTANANKLDLVQFSSIRVDADGNHLHYFDKGTGVCCLKDYISKEKFNMTPWGSLMRRDIIERGHLRFPENMKLAEDQVFIMEYMSACTKLQSIPDRLYYYLYVPIRYTSKLNVATMQTSIRQMLRMRTVHPIFVQVCNRVIVDFFMKILDHSSYPISNLAREYREANINTQVTRPFHRLFVNGCRINTTLTMIFFRTVMKIRNAS